MPFASPLQVFYSFVFASIFTISCRTRQKLANETADVLPRNSQKILTYQNEIGESYQQNLPLVDKSQYEPVIPEKFTHFPDDDFLTDLTGSQGFAIAIDKYGHVTAADMQRLHGGCFPYLVDAHRNFTLIFDDRREIEQLLAQFYSTFFIQSAGKLCIDDESIISSVTISMNYASKNSFTFLKEVIENEQNQQTNTVSRPQLYVINFFPSFIMPPM